MPSSSLINTTLIVWSENPRKRNIVLVSFDYNQIIGEKKLALSFLQAF